MENRRSALTLFITWNLRIIFHGRTGTLVLATVAGLLPGVSPIGYDMRR